MSGYASEYPDTPVNPGIQTFFETFYKTSDTPDAHDRYADSFTKDAVLIMASKKATGRSGTESQFCLVKMESVDRHFIFLIMPG